MKVDPNARMKTIFNRIAYLFIDSRKYVYKKLIVFLL